MYIYEGDNNDGDEDDIFENVCVCVYPQIHTQYISHLVMLHSLYHGVSDSCRNGLDITLTIIMLYEIWFAVRI